MGLTKKERERRATEKMTADWNKRVGAVHDAKAREQILALRPDWSLEKLQTVTRSWGEGGLFEILNTLKLVAQLEEKFKA